MSSTNRVPESLTRVFPRPIQSNDATPLVSGRGRAEIDPAGGQKYAAAALSLVFHPTSPMVPTFRADVRRFAVEGAGDGWYGGGADLTPYYLYEDDAREFHASWRELCDAHDPSVDPSVFDMCAAETGGLGGALHARCKRWCDEYFYIPARGEHRGVGGIFFDDMEAGGSPESDASAESPQRKAVVARDPEAFTRAVAKNWIASYAPIVERRRGERYGDVEERWHHQRRGRYVEFNLLYDRGVKFGLDGGRVESIMVSAPPRVRWDYNVAPEKGSREENLVEVLRNPRCW